MNSQPSPGFSSEAPNALRHVCAATLGALQHQCPSYMQQTSIPDALYSNHNLPSPLVLTPYHNWLNKDHPRQHQNVPSVMRLLTVPGDNRARILPTLPFTPSDDYILVQALSRGDTEGKNLSEVMAELSGINDHSTTDWVNYYIQNSQRIREKMTSEPRRPTNDATYLPSSRRRSRPFTQVEGEQRNMLKTDLYQVATDHTRRSHRRISRGSQGLGCSTSHTPDLRWPKPPSRHVKMGHSGRYRYTDEDKHYMMSFVECALKHDPDTCNSWIAKWMSARAPHHPASSWQQYMIANKEIIKRIRREVAGELRYAMRREAERVNTDAQSSTRETTAQSKEDAFVFPSPRAPNGIHGTDLRDMKCIANFIATNNVCFSRLQTPLTKWRRFALQHKPKRTPKAWSEFYKANKEEIDRWARHSTRGKHKRRKME